MIKTRTDRGYIIIFLTILFLSISVLVIVAVVSPIISNYTAGQSLKNSEQAFLAADSGTQEALYRLKNGLNIPPAHTFYLSSGSAQVNVSSTATGKRVVVYGIQGQYERNTALDLALGTGISFHYGIQSGDGGFYMLNSSSVTGNVFSSGPIVGAGNNIYGDIISAGASGLIDSIHATGTAYAHNIQNSTIDKNAYYVNLTNTTVGGTKYPGSSDQPPAPLPITDAQINQWESDTSIYPEATCTNGTFTVNSDTTIGPLKVPCNLLIKGSGIVVTINGPIWVVGNITTQVSPTVVMASNLGNQNVAIIADNKAASTTSSIITLGQGTTFQGSGSAGSFVFMISQNSSAENGGSVNAIDVGQSSNALVGYAIHGLITLGQSVSLKEVTAYKISLTNSSNVTYDTGLPNTLFEAGPGGGYDVLGWSEI